MEKRIDEQIDALVPEMVEEICHAVKIPSFQEAPQPDAPFGAETARILAFTLASGERKGFVVKNVDNYAGHIEFGSSGKLYAALGHLDVVPVEKGGADWSVPPFEGIVKDGAIWGRGASDDKGPTFAALYALYALKRLGVAPKNRIRIILGTNEETGWECV
ncbi:MAG TPA: M20/M25/M40 family metallo-hydrolase, partial [Thermotogota bacterium]|nr:M20/M25/M40 family metallo-hydrolase [Thermotogota bacterium]